MCTEKHALCICTNCDTVMIDTNPNGQIKLPIYIGMPELELMGEGEDFFQGCPKCQTDGYLMDVTEESQVTEVYHHTEESIEVWEYKPSYVTN